MTFEGSKVTVPGPVDAAEVSPPRGAELDVEFGFGCEDRDCGCQCGLCLRGVGGKAEEAKPAQSSTTSKLGWWRWGWGWGLLNGTNALTGRRGRVLRLTQGLYIWLDTARSTVEVEWGCN